MEHKPFSQLVDLDDLKLQCNFLDGPLRGQKKVRQKALQDGRLILGGTYRVQWNNEDWVWEAVTV